MAEMDGLKKRVELVDLRLKKAHNARERETAALMDTWEQIRNRFQDQSAEIVRLRSQVADLEDSRNDLQKMVYSLLEAVEGGLDSMADETVPQIKTMAGQLLTQNQEEVQQLESAFAPIDDDIVAGSLNGSTPSEKRSGQNFHEDLLSAIEKSIETVNGRDVIEDHAPSAPAKSSASSNKGEPVSPGIRNLISRIENAVGEEFLEPQSAGEEEEAEDDLSQDLREIEALREELHGLRHRIAAGA